MNFDLPEEITALQRMCRDFAEREIRPYAAEWSEREEIPSQVFHDMGELGLMGMLIDPKYGGEDAGFVAYVAGATGARTTSWGGSTCSPSRRCSRGCARSSTARASA